MSVRDWPTYLLWNIPVELREAISVEAKSLDLSLAETVRRILCERYELECEPVTLRRGGMVGYDADRDLRHNRLLLRVHPDLFEAIKEDALGRKDTMKSRIMEALEAHYERTPA